MSLVRPLRLLLLGAPGSGKGTQTSKLLKKYPIINSISSGDLLRRELAAKSALGLEASSFIKEGKLVPNSVICNLITEELAKNDWLNNQSTWLLDGFPRTSVQAEGLRKTLEASDASLNLVVELDVNPDVILERIENRWVHIPSGRVYNLQYTPPKVPFKDDVTGEPLSKRDDDKPEIFKRRIDQYLEELGPLKEFYASRNILHKVSGDTSDIIFPKLADLIQSKFGES